MVRYPQRPFMQIGLAIGASKREFESTSYGHLLPPRKTGQHGCNSHRALLEYHLNVFRCGMSVRTAGVSRMRRTGLISLCPANAVRPRKITALASYKSRLTLLTRPHTSRSSHGSTG